MNQITDDAILGMLFDRNEAALQELQRAYGKLCFKLAYDILDCREDSEECVNDMLLKVWQTIPPNRPDSLLAYVIAIVRNGAVNRYHAMKTQKRGGKQFIQAWEELESTLQSKENLEAAVDEHELTQGIEHFLDTLSVQTRNVFLRRYYMSESVQEIADRCGMSVSAVKISLMRSREKLKKYLRKEGLL
ncbi:MAG: sigma-70 family RNA polymerase sigma factor [Oscillospiraceae bacterium]|nr:sigma-70 family RNA polymerase sigma factor [Oscillospiraceae bacterium]